MQQIKLVRDELDSDMVQIYAPGYNYKLHLVATVHIDVLFLLVGLEATESLLDGDGIIWATLEPAKVKEVAHE